MVCNKKQIRVSRDTVGYTCVYAYICVSTRGIYVKVKTNVGNRNWKEKRQSLMIMIKKSHVRGCGVQ